MDETPEVPPSASQLRAILAGLVEADLLGPAGGPDEIVEEASVRGRYVLGVLAPQGQSSLLDAEEETAEDTTPLAIGADGSVDADDAAPVEEARPRAASMMPSSIGLTFSVEGNVPALVVTARWGRYHRIPHPDPEKVTKEGKPLLAWQRTQIEATSDPIPLVEGSFPTWTPAPEYPAVRVRGRVRRRASPDGDRSRDEWSVTLYLINDQQEPKGRTPDGKDAYWLFQPELIVEAPDGAPVFCKRPMLADPDQSPFPIEDETLAMQMIYRRTLEYAVGHGVSVHADVPPDGGDRAVRLSTRVIPAYEVGRSTPPTVDDIPALDGLMLDMRELAGCADADFAAAFAPLVDAYRTWIDDQAARVAHPTPDLAPYLLAAHGAIDNARTTLGRIEAGIRLLGSDPQAAEAFRFANRAMWLQRIRSVYAQQRRRPASDDGQEITPEAVDRPENRRWYPFQVAFILLNLPSLTDIHHPDRTDPTQAVADLLWFPTGGGKTEAYLGLTAYTLGLRRLQGVVGGHSGLSGVAVLMRYTLRLLTLQQFQRAAALICACERIRQDALAAGDRRWGEEPFRLGLWVGARSTPNTTDASAEAIKRHGGFAGNRGTPYQLTFCPWCGSEIREGSDLVVEAANQGRGRTLIYCGDKMGRCPFSRRKASLEGLPVLVVDEEIYRWLPSLLIATVDKFAQMPWKGEVQMLFGRVNGYCPRHGYTSPELKCASSHRAAGKFPATQTVAAGPLRPPDLIIQDELHLISGPLGTLVGLYETAVDALCSWQVDGVTVRPKVVASTATIRRAREQVNQLYLRRVSIFPPSGLDADDSFFARHRPPSDELPGRRYIGIYAAGTRIKALLIRVYVATMAAAQKLYEQYGAVVDPYMTQVGYFNSVRELGGMRRAVDDAVRTRLRRADERGLARRYLEHWSVEELTSRKSAADVPKILDRLEQPFDPKAKGNRPLDVLLATNMISVGVDVSRLGMMVVAGQPKTTAEYIQATSRVGRRHPGLVFVVYNWTRPRDLSHYERFEHYHATFYQHVEPLSVTPFSPRALNRGLTGVLVSLIRLAGEPFNDNHGAGRISRDHPLVQQAIDEIRTRAALVESNNEVENLVRNDLAKRLDHWLHTIQRTSGGSSRLGYESRRDGVTLGLLKHADGNAWDDFICLDSLRDVEAGIGLILDNYHMDQLGPRRSPATATVPAAHNVDAEGAGT